MAWHGRPWTLRDGTSSSSEHNGWQWTAVDWACRSTDQKVQDRARVGGHPAFIPRPLETVTIPSGLSANHYLRIRPYKYVLE